MVVYVGPGGIPISSPERSTIGGIKECARLGLNALEVEFVRGVNMTSEKAVDISEVAKKLKIRLSVHAPYYINLLSNKKEIVNASIGRILDSMHRGMLMKADAVAVHAGYYGNLNEKAALKKMEEVTQEILEKAEKKSIKNILLGYETMGKKSQWGSFDEILEIYDEFKPKVIPYIDWGHIFVRNQGKIDYSEILTTMKKIGIRHINSHFNCVKFSKSSNEWVDIHDLFETKHPDFEPLAELIVKRKISITLISESPRLEEDALKIKAMLEKYGAKFG
ncbi:MAG: TIM barrel protein [Candidatus Nanoarchaeia archaeon]